MNAQHQPPHKPPQIHVHHDLHPEDCAMLQALYSRSPASVVEHLEKVRVAGSGKFMANYYVGYGHASIGDCGVTTVFIENYSMLAAKAIQDNPLYSGQEASTRYLDFSAQPLIDPLHSPQSQHIQQGWLDLYNELMPQVQAALSKQYPFTSEHYKSEKIWQNAIAARAFDTLRGLLPLGTSTLLSWTTNLRQARDRLFKLATHPLPEVQALAQDVFTALHAQYPHSFNGQELDTQSSRYAARHAYYAEHGAADHYQSLAAIQRQYQLTPTEMASLEQGDIITRTAGFNNVRLNQIEAAALQERPAGADLPQRLKTYGTLDLIFALDFGSYRDLQRHRGGVCPLPLVTGELGLNLWYVQELERLLGPGHTWFERSEDLLDQIQDLAQSGHNKLLLQYLYPMGVNCAVTLNYTLPQLVYVAELRSSKTVHPSLRPVAQHMGRIAQDLCPALTLYLDTDHDSWSAKRGEQTITEQAA